MQASFNLAKGQAEHMALAAQEFLANHQQLQKQKAHCLAALRQASLQLAPAFRLRHLAARSAVPAPAVLVSLPMRRIPQRPRPQHLMCCRATAARRSWAPT